VPATGEVELAHTSELDLQAARFEPYQMSPQITLTASKTSKKAAVSASLAVVAFDVLGPGGIGDAWLEGGLNASMDMQCTNAAPSSCEGSTCSTVWLQPTSDDCTVFSTSHIRVAVSKLSHTLAMLNVTGATRGLGEGGYGFRLHVPAFNGTMWRWVSILGTFDVRAVADGAVSKVRLRVAASKENATGNVNHLADLEIQVDACDVDGNRINRTGEQMSIVVGSTGNHNRTVPLQFDGSTNTYVATFPPLSREAGRLGRPGIHNVYLVTLTSAGMVWKMQYTVACAGGYEYDDSRRDCLQDESKRYIILGCTVGCFMLAALLFLVYMVYMHKDRARAMIYSFLKHEFLLSMELVWELWNVGGAPHSYL
jgi:hypothetical protein